MSRRFFNTERLFDYWSVPHFLFGTVMALFAITYSLSTALMFFATLYLAIIWELLEARFRLREAQGNKIIDVFLPLLSFVITFFLIGRGNINPEQPSSLLIVTTILFLCLNFFAWRARFDRDRDFLG
jgi:hypothetical protein